MLPGETNPDLNVLAGTCSGCWLCVGERSKASTSCLNSMWLHGLLKGESLTDYYVVMSETVCQSEVANLLQPAIKHHNAMCVGGCVCVNIYYSHCGDLLSSWGQNLTKGIKFRVSAGFRHVIVNVNAIHGFRCRKGLCGSTSPPLSASTSVLSQCNVLPK